MSGAGAGPQIVSRSPRLVTSFLLAIGIWVAFSCVAFLVFVATFDLNSTLGSGPLDDQQAAAILRAHRADCESLGKWLWRDAAVLYPLRDPLPAHVRADYEAALSRIGAYDMTRERIGSGTGLLVIHLGAYGSALACTYTDLVWTSGPAPRDREPTAEDPDFTRYVPLGDGWFVRQRGD